MTSNRTRGIAALFVVSLCVVAAPASSDQPPQAPCSRPSPRAFDPGEVVEIRDTEAPCRLEVREAGVQLLAVEDGSRPDPGIQVRRDGRGRFYSAGAFGFGVTITLWDQQGRFLKAFGRAGEGPGELSDRGMITIFVDGEDRLHVRDGGFRWSVFSPEQEFLRSASASLASFQSGTVVLDMGMAVTGSRDGENYFRIVDSAGAAQRAFGVIPRRLRGARVDLERDITHAGGDSFWAGPIAGSPDGYQLEEWGIDGELRRVFRRAVDWFPSGDPTSLSDGEPPPTQVTLVHLDDSGLLYVYGLGPTRHWRSPGSLGRAPTAEEMDRMAQSYVKVIDTKSGRLLASERNLTRTQFLARFPHGFFRGSKEGYRYRQGDTYGFSWSPRDPEEEDDPEDLLPAVEIVSAELVAK